MRRPLSLTAAAAALVLLPGGAAAASLPAASATPALAGVVHGPIHVTSVRNDSVTSTNWSGYAVQSASQFTQVIGTWTQPTATCNSLLGHTYAAFWVGIDGYSSTSVEQLGSDSDCTGYHSPSYYAWYEMYPADSVEISTSSYPVEPGDTLTASVTRSGESYTLSIHSSRGWTYSTTQTGSYDNSSAEWVAEAPDICYSVFCTNASLTDFGSLQFSGAEAATGGSAQPISSYTADGGPHAITMDSSTGTVRATPSALTSNGEGFTDTWSHS